VHPAPRAPQVSDESRENKDNLNDKSLWANKDTFNIIAAEQDTINIVHIRKAHNQRSASSNIEEQDKRHPSIDEKG
jgi:hypothetical protein